MYEALRPKWFVSPRNNDFGQIREYWIRCKYEKKIFVRNPQSAEAISGLEREEDFMRELKKKMDELRNKEKYEAFLANSWYFLAPQGEVMGIEGPHSKREIIQFLTKGTIDECFYVWHPTLKNWEQLIDVEHFEDKNIKRYLATIGKKTSDLDDHLSGIPLSLRWMYLPRVLRGFLLVQNTLSKEGPRKYWTKITKSAIFLYRSREAMKDDRVEEVIPIQSQWIDMAELIQVIPEKETPFLGIDLARTDERRRYRIFPERTEETIEWYHNFKKMENAYAKLGPEFPIYDDGRTNYHQNTLDTPADAEGFLREGPIKEITTTIILKTNARQKYLELHYSKFYIYENEWDDIPKDVFPITPGSKVFRPQQHGGKVEGFPFQVEIAVTQKERRILNFIDSNEESVRLWISCFEKAIARAK
eukprot:TRINITY_DN12657_c0_g1_i1.p1 TRINITY_DN12657_c0_g1~~TRINITY_DN12657_c0_g1_i1.p1  ORF type:complete len:417 (+),score=60.64 TRINITY_DN12657_c0_g1_i1:290-1540(+)